MTSTSEDIMLATFRFNLSSGVRVVRSPLIAIHLDFQLMENLQVAPYCERWLLVLLLSIPTYTPVQLLPRFFPLLFTPVSFFVYDVTFLVEYDHRLIRLIRTGGRGPCGMYANVLLAHAPYNDTPFIGDCARAGSVLNTTPIDLYQSSLL